ncbi:MAG: NUDIX hydrolase [Candidatus Poribacteria bacterium]|nr:NUDIX hydrolase [Candidatus Poribacteria bacterium]
MYCYDFPRPSVTVDIVLFTDEYPHPQVLLIRRKNPPFKGLWALPGGFLEMDESLDEAALRELYEETDISNVLLTQIGVFGNPDRDPRGRVITVVYFGIAESEKQHIAIAGSDASEVAWFPTLDLPHIAFDHSEIIHTALKRLK